MSAETLGRRLFLLRLGSGLSQQQLADGINADRAARDFRKTVSELPQDRRLKIRMAPGGGYAARIYAR